MRLYDEAFETNLNIIRAIRNAFAHSKRVIEFDHPLVAAELKKIAIPTFRKRYFSKLKEFKPQTAYALLCLALTNELLKHGRQSAARGQKRSQQKQLETSPLYRAIAPALGLGSLYKPTDFSDALKSNRLSSPQNQTGDPSPQVQSGYAAALLPFLEGSNGKTDKK
jgi:hypothetical protein